MKKLKLILLGLALTAFTSACMKNHRQIDQGTYSGTFKVTYSSNTHTGTTTVDLKNSGKYACAGNSTRIPAGGSGKYSVEHGKILFTDENFWTADFDGNLILNGEYNYSFDGKHLKIWADKNNVGRYEYDLEKK
jgi:hypothetical protein